METECRNRDSLRDTSIKTRIETSGTIPLQYFLMNVSEILPLKQGLKPKSQVVTMFPLVVSEILPLKQGLKPSQRIGGGIKVIGLRDTSIKTRIETP